MLGMLTLFWQKTPWPYFANLIINHQTCATFEVVWVTNCKWALDLFLSEALNLFVLKSFFFVQTHFTHQKFLKLNVSTGCPLGPVISPLTVQHFAPVTAEVRTPDALPPMTKSLWMVPTQGSNFKQLFSLWRKSWTLLIFKKTVRIWAESSAPSEYMPIIQTPQQKASCPIIKPMTLFLKDN